MGYDASEVKVDVMVRTFYRGCQKNVPIEDRFSATNLYTAIIFSEHYYDKRYKMPEPAWGRPWNRFG